MDQLDALVAVDPTRTLVVAIDPQQGFAGPSGTFSRAFGAEDLEPIRAALGALTLFLAALPQEVAVVLAVSEYAPGQYSADDLSHPLSRLCVPGAGPDCQLIEGLSAGERWTTVVKREADAWSSGEFRSVIRCSASAGRDTLIVAGCTATTCVSHSVLSLLDATDRGHDSVVVVRDLVGARASGYRRERGGASRVERAYARMAAAGAVIVPTWRSLQWRSPDRRK